MYRFVNDELDVFPDTEIILVIESTQFASRLPNVYGIPVPDFFDSGRVIS